MALDDYVEPEVAIAAAAAAAIFSPRVRGVLRKGAVYGLAGVLVVGDAVGSFARDVGRDAQQATSTAADTAGDAMAATTDAAGKAASAVTDTTSSTVDAVADSGDTTNTVPATPKAAADELAAVAQSTTDGTPTTGRRSRRTHVEQTEGALNE